MTYTYHDVRASYGGAKAEQERHDLMFRFFARPLSFPIAWLGLRLGLRPNDVTVVSLVINVLGLAMMLTGSRIVMVTGVILVLLALVLDAADGNMARTARQFSPVGEWLEGIGSYLLCGWFHLAGGIGAWRALIKQDPVTGWPTTAAEGGWLIAFGAIAATGVTISILAAAKFSVVFPSVDRAEVVARRGQGFYGMLFTVGRNLSFASGLVLPLTLVGILTGRYEVVLAGFALLNTSMMVIVLGRCLLLAKKATRTGVAG